MADYATLPGGLYFGSEGGDSLDADADADALGSFDNLISAFGGADTIFAGLGDDLVFGGRGDDLISGGDGKDTLFAGGGNDEVDGGAGGDILAGGDGDDLVSGGDGNDWLGGGTGRDTLDGGAGNDTLAGGAGGDTFHFESGFGRDVVLDFRPGRDVVEIESDINGTGITEASQLASRITSDATGSVITLGGDQIKLVGVSADDLVGNLDAYVKIV